MHFMSLKRLDQSRFAQTASGERNAGGLLRRTPRARSTLRCALMHTSFFDVGSGEETLIMLNVDSEESFSDIKH